MKVKTDWAIISELMEVMPRWPLPDPSEGRNNFHISLVLDLFRKWICQHFFSGFFAESACSCPSFVKSYNYFWSVCLNWELSRMDNILIFVSVFISRK